MKTKAEAAIKAILAQGGNPASFRLGLAERYSVAVEVIDAIITAAGAPRVVDAETVAQERLAQERRARGTSAQRAYDHEEA